MYVSIFFYTNKIDNHYEVEINVHNLLSNGYAPVRGKKTPTPTTVYPIYTGPWYVLEDTGLNNSLIMCADKSNIRIVYGIAGFFETVNFDRIKVLAVKKKRWRINGKPRTSAVNLDLRLHRSWRRNNLTRYACSWNGLRKKINSVKQKLILIHFVFIQSKCTLLIRHVNDRSPKKIVFFFTTV